MSATTRPVSSRRARSRWAISAAGMVVAIGLVGPGCMVGDKLRSKAHVVGDLVAKARVQKAEVCAPKEFALAEAHLEFGKNELRTGTFLRASEHLELADTNARIAVRDSVGCVEGKIAFSAPTEGDRDGDGYPDHKDGCPDDPEDFDGFEDEDGCPDPDNDGDGILDVDDSCPMEPEDKDGFEDEDGCPDTDNDKDGLADVIDKCPMEPEDKDGFQDDDGCPDPDNDADGLLDTEDECPLQPEDFDGFEDEDGCPDPDNDGDGIKDIDDKCPNDPEDFDGDEDEDGCPDLYKLVVVTKDRIEIKEKIYFRFGKWAIKKASFPVLRDVGRVLKDYPKMKIRIEGHTDSRGKAGYNKKLSHKRAKSVLNFLVKEGIAADRMAYRGFGEEAPIDTNLTDEGRANNRRVEFHIVER